MTKLWQLRAALRVALDYLKSPCTRIDGTKYSDFAHYHICFARRIIGSNFKYVCPYYNTGELDDMPERADCCDTCPYYGIIDFREDEAGERSLYFWMHKPIVGIIEEYKYGD